MLWEGLPGGSVVKNPPAKQETWVQSLGWEDPLEKEMATHSSSLSWKCHGQRSPAGSNPWSDTELVIIECTHMERDRRALWAEWSSGKKQWTKCRWCVWRVENTGNNLYSLGQSSDQCCLIELLWWGKSTHLVLLITQPIATCGKLSLCNVASLTQELSS